MALKVNYFKIKLGNGGADRHFSKMLAISQSLFKVRQPLASRREGLFRGGLFLDTG
jgi:hypothetical protein